MKQKKKINTDFDFSLPSNDDDILAKFENIHKQQKNRYEQTQEAIERQRNSITHKLK